MDINKEIDQLLEDIILERQSDDYQQPEWVNKVQKACGATTKFMNKSKAVRKFGETEFAKKQARKNVDRAINKQREKVAAKVANGEELKPHEKKLWDDLNKGKKRVKSENMDIIREGVEGLKDYHYIDVEVFWGGGDELRCGVVNTKKIGKSDFVCFFDFNAPDYFLTKGVSNDHIVKYAERELKLELKKRNIPCKIKSISLH